jgi:hypothetical protein
MTLKMHKVEELSLFLNKVKAQKLPFATAYKLALFMQEVQKHLDFYQGQFRDLLIEYSKKDENGNPAVSEDGQSILLTEETASEANARLLELRTLDVELPDVKFSASELDRIELSPEDMMVAIPLIE